MITILLNDNPLTLDNPQSVTELLTQLQRQQPGTALAINNAIVPHEQWDSRMVDDGDNILLFQAIAGG